MSEDPCEVTPPVLRAAMARFERRQESKAKEPRLPVVTDSMTVGARFTLVRWGAIMGAVVLATLGAHTMYRNMTEEIRRVDYQREADRASNNELAASLRDLGKTISDLQLTVSKLSGEVSALRQERRQ